MLPVAIISSSGDQLTASTQLLCPFSVWTGVPVSQSKILALLSPLPVNSLDDDDAEKAVASIACPCPGIEEAHRDTARTLKTAWGLYCRRMNSSVLLSPGFSIEL